MLSIKLSALFCICIFSRNSPQVKANDFPSLLVANATVAILLDHEYLGEEYNATLQSVKATIEKVLREDMRDGGLVIKYYSWTQINFNKEFTAVISISNCKNTWRTYKEAMRETLVYIALTDTDCPRLPKSNAIMIPILAVGQELPQVLLDIRSTNAINWKNGILIYDDIFDRDTVSRVLTTLSSESPNGEVGAMSISMFKINGSDVERDAITKTLSSFSPNYIGTNYFVIASAPHLIMEVAGELGMVDSFSQWLFMLSTNSNEKYNLTSITSAIREGGNVALAINSTTNEKCSSTKACHFEEIFRIFAIGITRLVVKEAAIYGQISDEEWEAIRLSKRERLDYMIEHIQEQLLKSKMCSTCSKWTFQAAETWGLKYDYTQKNKSMLIKEFKPVVSQVAYWEPTNGLILEDVLFPHVSHGFRNKTMPIIAYHNPPWQIINYSEDGDIVSMKGVVIHILNELSDKLNFTYFIIDPIKHRNITALSTEESFENATSYKSTLNIPEEVLELILANKVLMGAVGVTVNEHYTSTINFTRPISVQSYTLLIARPKELGRLYLFAAPFSGDTWLCLTFTILIIGPLLYAINFLTPYNEHFNILKKGGLYKFGNCFWYIYGALLQQGGMYLPRSDSARLIVGTWWLVVLVVVTTYCGNLVAFLTFPKIDTPITNVNQLLRYENEITWGIRAQTYLEDYLKDTDDIKYRRLGDGAIVHTDDSNEIIEMVRRGKHVYIDWKSNLQYLMKREFLQTDRCDFGLGTEEFLDERIAMIMPLNSPYLKIVNKEVYRMLQMGFVQKWLTEYLPSKDRCWKTGKSVDIDNHTVNLNDMQGCFLVLGAGTLAAIVIIVIECLWKKRTKYTENNIIKPFSQ